MKGTVFQENCQIDLNILGESWIPGQIIKGTLEIKNLGPGPIAIQNHGVGLGHGEFKKVQTSNKSALVPDKKTTFEANKMLGPGASESLEWSFNLPETAPITDKAGSLFIMFGNLEDKQKGGHLQLTVSPRPLIKEFCQLIENFQRFKVKEWRQKKDRIQIKLVPPNSREFAGVESLILLTKEVEGSLHLDYEFGLKKIGYGQGEVAVQKQDLKLNFVLPLKQITFGKDMIDQDKILNHLNDVFGQAKMKSNY